MKGALLNADIPKGRIVVASLPAQWIQWGLVEADALWILEKVAYGFRESPALWSAEHDGQLLKVEWSVGKRLSGDALQTLRSG